MYRKARSNRHKNHAALIYQCNYVTFSLLAFFEVSHQNVDRKKLQLSCIAKNAPFNCPLVDKLNLIQGTCSSLVVDVKVIHNWYLGCFEKSIETSLNYEPLFGPYYHQNAGKIVYLA